MKNLKGGYEKIPLPVLNDKIELPDSTNKLINYYKGFVDAHITNHSKTELSGGIENENPETKPLDEKLPLPILTRNTDMVEHPENEKCAPLLQYASFSCIPVPILQKLAESYNEFVNNDRTKRIEILTNKISVDDVSSYKKYLVCELSVRLGDNQTQWVNSNKVRLDPDMQSMLRNDIFRPEGPTSQFEWMDSVRLDRVMKQYENSYLSFKYLGTLPIDFDRRDFFNEETMTSYLQHGKYKFGMIVNNQTYAQGGEHWFCIFLNIKEGNLYFIDSVGNPPMDEIKNFLNKIADILKGYNKPVTIRYNNVQHQRKNSECGVYSMYFILALLNDKNYDDVINNVISDDEMNTLRLELFHGMPHDWREKTIKNPKIDLDVV